MPVNTKGAGSRLRSSSVRIYPEGATIPRLPPGTLAISKTNATGSILFVGTKQGNTTYGVSDVNTKVIGLESATADLVALVDTRAGAGSVTGLGAATAQMISGAVVFSNINVGGGSITASSISSHGPVSAQRYYGDGSFLQGVTADLSGIESGTATNIYSIKSLI